MNNRSGFVQFLRGWVLPIAVGVAVALSLKTWVVSAALVPSGSMEPTIPDPCYIVVNKLATEFSPLYRGEIVLFHYPDDPSQIFVKRLIGLPGDTVTVTSDSVLVNGKKIADSYAVKPNGTTGTYIVPSGHYFMLGDNRPNSKDSRLWIHKFVAKSQIVGKAEIVVFPFSKWKVLR